MRIRKTAAAIAIALAAPMVTAVELNAQAAPRPVASHHVSWCHRSMRKLAHPESLDQWFRETGIPPAIELHVVAQCDGYSHGWTRNIAILLDGGYGPKLDQVKLPAGTRLWDML
jgi:hypothetical protein